MKNSFFIKNGISLLAISLASAALAVALLKPSPKIAYAETPLILNDFSEAVKARKKFEESQKEWESNLKLINDSLVAAMNEIKVKYESSPKPQQDAMRNRLDKWNSDFGRYSESVKDMAKLREKELMDPVLSELNAFLKQWGEREGYDMIFGTTTGGNILQGGIAFNVTSRFLADLNAHYKDLPSKNDVSAPKPIEEKGAMGDEAAPKKGLTKGG